MGKKSRRQQRNAAKKEQTRIKQIIDNKTIANLDLLRNFVKLLTSSDDDTDIETLLRLESKVIGVLRSMDQQIGLYALSGSVHRLVKTVYYELAGLYQRDVQKPEGCDKAVSYYRKAIDFLNHEEHAMLFSFIVECYVKFDRMDEAVKAFEEYHSSLIANGKELDPGVTDRFANVLFRAEILAKIKIAIYYTQRLLSLARAKKDQEMEVEKLKLLGSLYERSCEHESAMNHLEKALVIRKESEYSKQEVIGIYIQIGYELLKEGAGNEQIALNLHYKALTLYQKALAEGCCDSKGQLDSICSGIGIAYHCLREWDSAIILLKKSVECVEHAEHKAYAYLYLGSTYLEVYRITDDPEEQIRILNQALEHVMKCDSKLIELETDKQLVSVKILYLLGLREHAFRILEIYFDLEVVGSRRTHVYCECCGQHDEKSVKLWMCSGCKVQCNCNKSHQRKRWRGKFADHRTLCPLLNRWRKVMKKMKIGKHSKDSFKAIMNNYLDTIEKDYSKDHIGTEDRRRGSALRSLVFLQVCINSASSYYITYAPADTTYLKCLKESYLLSKQDIEKNDLYFWSFHNASQLRFEYIASLDPEGSKRYRYEGRPLIHAMIHHYHDSNEFSMFLATALKHHPGDIGLLFQKDNEGKTAFECAMNKYGNEAVFGVIEERIPVNGAKLPILHHVGQHARQHFKEFGKWNPSAVFLRDNKGREMWQALLASGSRTFNKDSKFFETMTDDQVNEVDPASGLYPFMMSASGQMTSDLSAVYYLLRRNPSLLSAS